MQIFVTCTQRLAIRHASSGSDGKGVASFFLQQIFFKIYIQEIELSWTCPLPLLFGDHLKKLKIEVKIRKDAVKSHCRYSHSLSITNSTPPPLPRDKDFHEFGRYFFFFLLVKKFWMSLPPSLPFQKDASCLAVQLRQASTFIVDFIEKYRFLFFYSIKQKYHIYVSNYFLRISFTLV